MNLNICILYPDLLNSYGDTGNAALLSHRAAEYGIETTIHSVTLADTFDPALYDIVLMGGGQFHEQSIVAEDLRKEKGEKLKEYVHDGGVTLLICGAYQLAGDYYVDDNGKKEDGLGILPVYTTPNDKRMVGDIVLKDDEGRLYAGFENHLGKTYIGDLAPFATVVAGFGNNGEDGVEGCRFKNTIGTYLHGPLLSKNPELADWLIEKALERKGIDFSSFGITVDDEWANAAKLALLKRLGVE